MVFFNRYFDKTRLKTLVLWNLTRSGEKRTIDLVEKLKNLGFNYATQAGLSLSIDDLKIPPTKPKLILEAELIVQASQQDSAIGNLTSIEKFQQMIDVWHRTSEVLKQNVVQNFRSTNILNPVYMMAFSGARGNISQVRQLVGMRGLMADPQGQILDFPIRSNFREGLTLTEYIISCYGARKGLVDTALRTANSGYLTRRLVDVAQHIIVRQFDCGTKNGIFVTDMKDGKKIILSLQKRIVGRVLAENIESIGFKNQDISPGLAIKIGKLKTQVLVRSPLTCEAKNSICQLCYGWSLAHGNLVSLGEAVGVLAAQSIGEPGTQLTMRTFHTGGVFSGDVMQEIRSPLDGFINFSSLIEGNLIRTLHGKIAFLTKIEGNFTLQKNIEPNSLKTSYQFPPSTIIFVRQFEKVTERQLIAEYSSYVINSNQGIQAKYNLNSEKEGQIFFENVLLVVKGGKEGDIIKTALKFGSIWILSGKLYESPIRSNLFTKPGDLLDTKSIVNESILLTPYTGFLEQLKKSNRKEIFFSKKIQSQKNRFQKKQENKQLEVLHQLLTERPYFCNPGPIKQIQNEREELVLKQPFSTSFIKNIKYKNLGYFVTIKDLKNVLLFFPNSLHNPSISFNQIFLQIFDNQNLKHSGIVNSSKKKYPAFKECYFLYSETFYKIKETSFSKNLKNEDSYKKLFWNNFYIKKQTNLFYIKNAQGNKQKIISKQNPILLLNKILIEEKINKTKIFPFNKKKNFFYKENPYREIYSQLGNSSKQAKNYIFLEEINQFSSQTKSISLQKKQLNIYKKCFIANTICKNKLIIQKEKNQQIFFTGNPFSQIKIYKQYKNKKNKKIDIKFQLQSGWITLPTNSFDSCFFNNYYSQPGNFIKNLHFDQIISFSKIIQLQKNIYIVKKPTNFQKIRYIYSSLVRYNKYHQKNRYTKTNRKKEDGIFLKKIIRNKIYRKNLSFQIKFLLLTKKIKELNLTNKFSKVKFVQNFSNTLFLLNFYKINSFSFNKQNHTRFKPLFPSIDIKISQCSFKKPNFLLSFNVSKNIPIKQTKLELLFPLNLQFSIIRKLNTSNFLLPKNLSTEKLKLTKQKKIFEQTSLSFNSFFSPYPGEIASRKKNAIGKQKSLLLTNKDQMSFTNTQKNLKLKIGQLLRYGDPLQENFAVQESGQIIQIDKNKITLRKAQPILFSSQGVFHVDNGDLVEKNTPLITLFYRKLKTEDIVQGIPKIEELFEARQTKEGESIQENLHTKLNLFFKYYKQHFTSQVAVKKSIEKIQQILVNNVQKVYQSQGVTIADKHIEIIVRQMTTKVKITESGRTSLLRGELVDLDYVQLLNLGIEAQNEFLTKDPDIEKAEYEPIILGITKAALETESFISASSFQETTRILSRAAIERKTDFLRGLKENVILGHLIPAGTGFRLYFNTQPKIDATKKKLSLLTYKDILKKFQKEKISFNF